MAAPSVKDNSTYECRGCGAVVSRGVALHNPCPGCGARRFQQIATTHVCDFCSMPLAQTEETWTHYAHEHVLPTPPGVARHVQNAEWAACATCHGLIEVGDAEALLDRAVEKHVALHPELPRNFLRMAVAVPHAGFWAHLDVDRPSHRDEEENHEAG